MAELTPLVDPSSLRTGDDLPVRLAVDLGVARDVEVAVERRGLEGQVERSSARTGEHAVALVRLGGPGAYALSAQVQVGHGDGSSAPAVTTLAFTIGDLPGGRR
jgi:hypothetical protein